MKFIVQFEDENKFLKEIASLAKLTGAHDVLMIAYVTTQRRQLFFSFF